MKLRSGAVGILLVLLAWAAGCGIDGQVLWTANNEGGKNGVGGAGGDPALKTSSTLTGLHYPSTGASLVTPPSGGMGPVDCPTPDGQICNCIPNRPCTCATTPMQPLCEAFCNRGGCLMDCMFGSECHFDCAFNCQVVCHPDSTCDIFTESGSEITCLTGSTCTVWSWGGPSMMYCDDGATCSCKANCKCQGPGCPPAL